MRSPMPELFTGSEMILTGLEISFMTELILPVNAQPQKPGHLLSGLRRIFKIIQSLYDVMQKLAAKGNVILTGRGGQYILENFENTFHLLMVADKQDRVDFMKRHYKLSDAKAKAAVAGGEKRRNNLYRKFGKQDYNDPIHYHMVFNMSRIPLEKALDLVCRLVKG